MSKGELWTEAERRAFAPPRRQTPTEWAEANRVLPPQITAEAGPYRASRTPYLTGIMDAITEVGVTQIVCIKAAQIGWSEAMRNILGYWIDNDPGPALLIMPSEQAAREIVSERIRPLIDHTPAVKRHLSGNKDDNTKSGIVFDTMSLHLGWAGSPQSLASRPIRYCLFDEVDKYPAFSGKEADPISLGTMRVATYRHRARVLIGSTPTTRQGHIWRAWEGCGDRRHYYIPCPHCSHYQRLTWGQVKWPQELKTQLPDRQQRADHIQTNSLAWYECEACKGQIMERHKGAMLRAGIWLSEGQTIDNKGNVSGVRPKTARVGFHISALYSPWCSLSALAAEGLRCDGDPQRWMNFKNSYLGEVFEERVAGIKSNDLMVRRATSPDPGTVPEWAGLLIASADVQADRYYYCIRAWGHGSRSQLIHAGVVYSLEELYQRCLGTSFPLAGGGQMTPNVLVIDSGYRTHEIYEFSRRDARIICIKGANQKQATPVRVTGNAAKDFGVVLRYVDTTYFKDRLASLRADPDRWAIHKEVTDEYCQHQASEHQVLDRKRNKVQRVWVPVTEGADNHYFDCEVYSVVGAQVAGVDFVPTADVLIEQRRTERLQAEQRLRQQGQPHKSYLGDTSGWLKGK